MSTPSYVPATLGGDGNAPEFTHPQGNLQFATFENVPGAPQDDMSGNSNDMMHAAPPFVSGSTGPVHRHGAGVVGKAQDFLYSKGAGWMFEVEDDEDESLYDVPLLEELDIDVSDIVYKVRCVLWPFKVDRSILVARPDFWGPLAVVCAYAFLLVWGQFRVVSWIIMLWIIGSYLVFLLARVLGGDVTYSQTLGVVGYSLLPLVIMVMLQVIVGGYPVLAFLTKFVGTVWSSYSAGSLLINEQLQKKKLLLIYPISLLFIYFVAMY